ncbi:MAG: ANL family adenylate-forming protein [Pseudonocardia sp.]
MTAAYSTAPTGLDPGPVGFLLERFAEHPDADALVWQDRTYAYRHLTDRFADAAATLDAAGVPAGAVVSLEADFSPTAVAVLLAVVARGCVVVPLSSAVAADRDTFRETAQVEWIVDIDAADAVQVAATGRHADHELVTTLRERGHPGLVLFSSGSTGVAKAAVHDMVPLLAKFHVRKRTMRMIAFLLFDHIGGVNTLLYALSNGGCVITVEDRGPDAVCAVIARHCAEVLPTSPTFLNLLLAGEAHTRHDLASLRTVTYGTEPMPENTLRRVHAALPGVRLQQTYGLSELGILRSESRGPDSLWVRVGGEGYEWRVVDGLLEIKARAALLGYFNAPSPMTADGWFRTGDAVEVDGEWLRILGRRSEIINVGGEKVYPAEVEGVLLELPGVAEVVVYGEANAITGKLVAARVRLEAPEPPGEFRRRMTAFCRDRLARYKIPQKIRLVDGPLHNERFKAVRKEQR